MKVYDLFKNELKENQRILAVINQGNSRSDIRFGDIVKISPKGTIHIKCIPIKGYQNSEIFKCMGKVIYPNIIIVDDKFNDALILNKLINS